ncbi:hypothetical protein EUX98_g9436 [Antrodiella citrinella]|uniref:Uncharacterized protein n=1 Tax=Antrodiella citrinella TaxID=2447956 RepID=A0A4S4LT70_9APHY|nr:hypothetical protein EUX98_g9436 [Antrodiella citrinella]
MSSVFQATYYRFFLQPDFNNLLEDSSVGPLSCGSFRQDAHVAQVTDKSVSLNDSAPDMRTLLKGCLHDEGIRSIFRLAVLREQSAAKAEVQASAIASLRARLAALEKTSRSLGYTPTTNSDQTRLGIDTVFQDLMRERTLNANLSASLDALRNEKEDLRLAKRALQDDHERMQADAATTKEVLDNARVALMTCQESVDKLEAKKAHLEEVIAQTKTVAADAYASRDCALDATDDNATASPPDLDAANGAVCLDSAVALRQSPTSLDAMDLHLAADSEPTHDDIAMQLMDVTTELLDERRARDLAASDISRLEDGCAAHLACLRSTEAELSVTKNSLRALERKLEEQTAVALYVQSLYEDEQARAQNLSLNLEKNVKDLGALHQTHFALQVEYKKTIEVLEDEKAELELSLFATELAHDIVIKNEAELTTSLKEKATALVAAEARADIEIKAKETALSDSQAAHCRVLSLQAAIEHHTLRANEIDTETRRLQAAILERDNDAKAALNEADERCHTLSKQLEGEAHHDTRNHAAREDESIEVERQQKTDLDVCVQEAEGELTKENDSLVQSRRTLENALLAKVKRCDELEAEVARLEDRVQILQEDGNKQAVSAPRKSVHDKENALYGSMYDVDGASAMDTKHVRPPTTSPESSPDSRNIATRLFNPQSIRKFFVSPSL